MTGSRLNSAPWLGHAALRSQGLGNPLKHTCGGTGGLAGGCSGLEIVLFLGLFNHLVIGWWGLSHEKQRCSHTRTHIIFPWTIAFPLYGGIFYLVMCCNVYTLFFAFLLGIWGVLARVYVLQFKMYTQWGFQYF